MQKILLAFAAGYIVATMINKTATVSPVVDPGIPVLVAMEYDDPTVKGIGGTLFPIHQGQKSKLLQI